MENEMIIELPIGFVNCEITELNYFTAKTDNKEPETIKFPLPKPKGEWLINGYDVNNNKFDVYLIDYK